MAEGASHTTEKLRRHGRKRKRATTDRLDGSPSKASKIASELPRTSPAAGGDIDESIGQMDPGLLADHVAKKIKRSFRELSSIELEDMYLSQKVFYDTSEFDMARRLDNLPAFLEHFSSGNESLATSDESTGSPHTLVVAASGLRAADVTRSLRRYQSQNCAVAKLFAKHIKLPEAVEYCKCTRIGIAIGTPQRVIDLLDKSALKTQALQRVVIDGSYLDQKKRSIFDMKELLDPLMKLLSTPAIKNRLNAAGTTTRVLVF